MTIETRGNKIILNGEEILKGVNMHAQLHGRSAYSSEDAECLLGWAKEMDVICSACSLSP